MLIRKIVLSFSFLLLSTYALAEEVNLPLSPEVNEILNHVDPTMNMSALVVDLNTGDTLYSKNPNKSLVPASNMKLFSDAAALLALGPNYRFESVLSTNAKVLDNGNLEGNVYLYLPGDPSFTSDDLANLLGALQDWRIQSIQGNLIIISDRKGIHPYAPGWTKRDLIYSYGAPLAPLMLDENRLVVTVNPGARVGSPALIEVRPSNPGIVLHNQVTTKTKSAGCGISYVMDKHNELTVKGCVGSGQWSARQGLAIKNPSKYAKAQIRESLKDMGITLHGKIKYGQKPKHAMLLAKHQSKPISQLITDTMKTSDNLYADSLYLHTAAKLNGAPANWAQAQPLVKDFLEQETGIRLNQANLTDGSGLSRQDKLSAKQTVQLLQFLHARFPLAYEYIAALPVSGRDGTLRKRLKKPEQKGFVRAKTGTMTGIVSLSGYLYTENGHTLAFAIYINKRADAKVNHSWRYPKLIDAMCDYFLKQKPKKSASKPHNDAHSQVAFQHSPSQAELKQTQKQKWRHIELALKRALKDKPVAVIYRDDHLVLDDQSADPTIVWRALEQVSAKYPVSAALKSALAPAAQHGNPTLLWIKSKNATKQRVWTITDQAS